MATGQKQRFQISTEAVRCIALTASFFVIYPNDGSTVWGNILKGAAAISFIFIGLIHCYSSWKLRPEEQNEGTRGFGSAALSFLRGYAQALLAGAMGVLASIASLFDTFNTGDVPPWAVVGTVVIVELSLLGWLLGEVSSIVDNGLMISKKPLIPGRRKDVGYLIASLVFSVIKGVACLLLAIGTPLADKETHFRVMVVGIVAAGLGAVLNLILNIVVLARQRKPSRKQGRSREAGRSSDDEYSSIEDDQSVEDEYFPRLSSSASS